MIQSINQPIKGDARMAKTKSRRERFDEAAAKINDSLPDFEGLRDELQDWLDNIPENLRESEKAS